MIEFEKIKTIPSIKKEIFEFGNSDVSLFMEYFKMRYNRYKDRFIVETRFLWQMYQKQSKIKILLVNMSDGDTVYCYIKNVTVYPAIYLILMGKPISKSGNIENEEKVLFELCKYKHIKGFESIQEEIDTLNSKELFVINPPYYEEFYIDMKERFENYLNKGAWRSKYSINKLKSNPNFVFREFQKEDYEQNKELVDLWRCSKNIENKVKFETKSYSDILEQVYKNNSQGRYIIYNLFFKGKLIGCLMFLTLNDLRVSYQEHNINLSRYYDIQNDINIDMGISKNIGNIMYYLTTEDLIKRGFEFSYCQGNNFWNKKKSGEYKERLNNKRIEFTKVFWKN